jgi:hydrogenase maturation protease
MQGKKLVLGLGNTIMADDGVGPRVIELLKADSRVPADLELLDGGTLGLDLLPYLEGVSLLVIVDAVETGKAAGTMLRLSGEDVPVAMETKLSPHQMGMKDLLAVARLMGQLPESIVLIGVQPERLEMDTELSPTVHNVLPDLVNMVISEISPS